MIFKRSQTLLKRKSRAKTRVFHLSIRKKRISPFPSLFIPSQRKSAAAIILPVKPRLFRKFYRPQISVLFLEIGRKKFYAVFSFLSLAYLVYQPRVFVRTYRKRRAEPIESSLFGSTRTFVKSQFKTLFAALSSFRTIFKPSYPCVENGRVACAYLALYAGCEIAYITRLLRRASLVFFRGRDVGIIKKHRQIEDPRKVFDTGGTARTAATVQEHTLPLAFFGQVCDYRVGAL